MSWLKRLLGKKVVEDVPQREMSDYDKLETAASLIFEVYLKRMGDKNLSKWLDKAHMHCLDSMRLVTVKQPEVESIHNYKEFSQQKP